ncbi:hypothetical protein BR93DRAFT_550856 [Coniochaeta sp. PMI_546]|nr:hypothetical protein BR93DRAFT_550856 [Coniochaeta sp. PMI_546]
MLVTCTYSSRLEYEACPGRYPEMETLSSWVQRLRSGMKSTSLVQHWFGGQVFFHYHDWKIDTTSRRPHNILSTSFLNQHQHIGGAARALTGCTINGSSVVFFFLFIIDGVTRQVSVGYGPRLFGGVRLDYTSSATAFSNSIGINHHHHGQERERIRSSSSRTGRRRDQVVISADRKEDQGFSSSRTGRKRIRLSSSFIIEGDVP